MKRALFLALALIPVPSFGQDVYNFYFQKADHPAEMIQVKNGESVSPVRVDPTSAAAATASPAAMTQSASASGAPTQAPALAPASVSTTVTGAISHEEKKSYWRVELARAMFTDHAKRMDTGYGLDVEYGLNKYFGFEAQIMGGNAYQTTAYTGAWEASTKFAGALGIKVTPVHVELFGWDFLDVALLAGALTTTGRDEASSGDLRIAPYIGAGVGINFTERLALAIDGKFEDVDGAYGQMMAGIAYKF